MRTARLVLLMLLAVLLPVRGAMAAAMLCPTGTAGTVAATSHAMNHSGMGHHGHAGDAVHEHAQEAHNAAGDHHDDSSVSSQDKCNLCSAYCSMTPLLASATPSVPHLEPAATVFPRLSAPAPRFVSDGQERPPRTI